MEKFSLLRTTVGDCYRVDCAKEKRAVKEKQKSQMRKLFVKI